MESEPRNQSKFLADAPRLNQTSLTLMLAVMCCVPVVTIFALWSYLPKVHEGQLDAKIGAAGLPAAIYYADHYSERDPHIGGVLLVTNVSDQDWTHINIQVNRNYQIYDTEPIKAGQTREFNLEKFISRSGAAFSLRYNPLRAVRVYARQPSRDRATCYYEFPVEMWDPKALPSSSSDDSNSDNDAS